MGPPEITTTLPDRVVPVSLVVVTLKTASLSGVVISKSLEACGEGVAEIGAAEGDELMVGVTSAVGFWACFRLLLAVQIPKVITRPITKPITIARMGSFI